MNEQRAKLLDQAYLSNASPCPRCLALAMNDALRVECVMPLFAGALAPLAVDGEGACCMDCAAADLVVKMLNRNAPARSRHMTRWRLHPKLRHDPKMTFDHKNGVDFEMARIAVGNDRQESLRLPGVPLGLIYEGWVWPSNPGDLEKHHAWMRRVHIAPNYEVYDD